jgi:type 2 lantibiotic biosynthesis protein LanM
MVGEDALTLGEYLDLPAGRSARPEVMKRLDAAIAFWDADAQPAETVPTSLDSRTGEQLRRLVGERRVAPGHPIAAALDELDETLRSWTPAGECAGNDWENALYDIIAPLVDDACERALLEIARHPGLASPDTARDACREWLRSPPPPLLQMVISAFVVDMRAARGLADETQAVPNWFEHHLAAVCSDPGSRKAFFARYPLLTRTLCVRLRNWSAAAVEFALRLDRDQEAVAGLLGADRLALLRVETGLGDAHNGGRGVARVIFEEGSVAYKPRSLRVVEVFRDLLRLFDDRYGVPVEVFLPKTVGREDYGWTEWIEPEPCRTVEEIGRHYRLLGQLQAVAWLLGATDLHSANIVASGGRPFLVDCETLLSPISGGMGANAGPTRPEILGESPMSTGILPVDAALDLDHARDISAFGDGTGESGWEAPDWAAAGTADMHATTRRVPLPPPTSLPTLADGTKVDPYEYDQEFLTGIRETSAALARIAGDVAVDPSVEPLLSGTPIRVLLRPTAQYAQIIRALRHPAVLHNAFLAEGAFECLLQDWTHADPGHRRAVYSAERVALLRGDIPYFEVHAQRRDLVCCDGSVIEDFYAASPLDHFRRRANRLAANESGLRWAAEAAVHCGRLNAHGHDVHTADQLNTGPGRLREASRGGDGHLVAGATALAEWIARMSYDDGAPSWLSVTIDENERWKVLPAGGSLYLGTTGILLFLDALCRETGGTAEVRRVREALWEHWIGSDPAELHEGNRGALIGLAGDLYATRTFMHHSRDPRLDARAAVLVDQLDDEVEGLDLLTGAAGIVVVLCRVAAAPRNPLRHRAMATAARHVRRLLREVRQDGRVWDLDDERRSATGFAHGTSGIAYALHEFADVAAGDGRWAQLTGECRAIFDRACEWERSRGPAARRWPTWCNGAAGLALARAAALRKTSPEHATGLKQDLGRAVDSCLSAELGRRYTLCHGDLGVAEMLLEAARSTGRRDWRDTAMRIGAEAATWARDSGDRIAETDDGATLSPGLLGGAAGVGYELLRLASPSRIPSVLTLECPA